MRFAPLRQRLTSLLCDGAFLRMCSPSYVAPFSALCQWHFEVTWECIRGAAARAVAHAGDKRERYYGSYSSYVPEWGLYFSLSLAVFSCVVNCACATCDTKEST